MQKNPTSFDVIVIGGGQAGLSVGYHLKKRGLKFMILDGSARVGDAWRKRWDSLRLFTCARYDSLDGLPFPAHPQHFPSKDEMADYLEHYAAHFQLPILSGVQVDKLSKQRGRYVVRAGERELEADQVVVAMSSYQKPRVPAFASELDPSVVQLHSLNYQGPAQLREGGVLLVGAGNSGAELAMELSKQHRVTMSGRDVGQVPFRIEGFWGRHVLVRLVIGFLFHWILSIKTPIGRKVRPKLVTGGGPRIRTKASDLAVAGVERAPKMVGVEGGRPVLEDGRVLDVTNVIWCTGFHPAFSWIDLPIFDARGEPRHLGGVVGDAPGLYFVGLHFLYSLSSTMVRGVGRDAQRIAKSVASHAERTSPLPTSTVAAVAAQ